MVTLRGERSCHRDTKSLVRMTSSIQVRERRNIIRKVSRTQMVLDVIMRNLNCILMVMANNK